MCILVLFDSSHLYLHLIIFRKADKISKGVKIKIYSSNSFGRSEETVMLETSLSKVAELQSGKCAFIIIFFDQHIEIPNHYIPKPLIRIFIIFQTSLHRKKFLEERKSAQ